MSKFGAWSGLVLASVAAAAAAPVEELWNARFNGQAGREDLVFAMTVDSAGRAIVTGSSDNNVHPDPFATIKYDTNGAQLWVARYTGPRQIDLPSAIAVDAQGYIYVTGLSHGTASNYDPDYTTIKYAPEGTELWVARYNGAGTNFQTADTPAGLVISAIGDVYVTGSSMSVTGTMDVVTIKYDGNGNESWVARYDGPDGRNDHARAIGIDGNGNIYVAGISQRDGVRYDIALIKYSPAGAPLWITRFDVPGTGAEPPVALKVDASGNAHIAWSSPRPINQYLRSFLAKYDASGNRLWLSTQHTVRDDVSTAVVGVDLDDGGNACLLAQTALYGNADYLVVKFSPTGDELWSSRFAAQPFTQDMPKSLVVDDLGNIYATGLTYPNNNYFEFATVKFRPNGHRQWVAQTGVGDSTGQSEAIVRVDTAGHVFVSGSVGPFGNKDYYTVKYRQRAEPGAPEIITLPTAQTVPGGSSVTFSVAAIGAEPLSYQWWHEGRLIAGATGSTLLLSNLDYGAHGYYSVEVSNSVGSAASPQLLLQVLVPPFIWDHPAPQQVVAGASARFRVTAGGPEPLAFQWYHDDTLLPGQTNATLVLSNVQPVSTGNYFVTVSNTGGSTNSESALLSLVPGVEQCFGAEYRAPGENYTFPQWMRVDAEGRTTLAQTLYHPNNRSEFLTVQFDTNGMPTWSARFALGTNSNNAPQGLAIDAQGNIYVAGNAGAYPNQNEIAVVKYGPAGNRLWAQGFTGGSNTYAAVADIAIDPGGNVFVAGAYYDDDAPQDFLTIKFNAAGEQQWARLYSRSLPSTDVAVDVEVNAAGEVYVFGTSYDQIYRHVLLKYDRDGNLIWERQQDAGREAQAVAMKLDAGGNVCVTGSSVNSRGDTDFVTMKYDPDGNLLWLSRYGGLLDGYDYPYALALDANGNTYVAGSSSLPGEENTGLAGFALVKYGVNGNELWVASRVDNGGYSGRDGLTVDSAGNAYLVFPKYRDATATDLLTIKYDSDGTRLWSAHASRPDLSDDYPSSIALSPQGGVLVSGLGTYPDSAVLLFRLKDREAPGLPVITQSPLSRDVAAGTPVTFTVAATGDQPLAYQWYFNSKPIAGATGPSYVIQSVASASAGHYSVEVSNPVGVVLSRSAVLRISVPPVITRQPHSQSVLVGADVTLSVDVSGSEPLRYQWRVNGTNIPGAHSASLTIANVQIEHSGTYSVVVSNNIGYAASADALLSVSRQGRRDWLAFIHGASNTYALTADMAVSADGSAYIAGRLQFGYSDGLVAKFDVSGQLVWSTNFGVAQRNEAFNAIAVDAAGNAYVTGYAESTNGNQGIVTIKYDAAGNQVWMSEFRPPNHAVGNDIVVRPDGNVYVTGYSEAPAHGFTTIKYSPGGTQLWASHYSGPNPQRVYGRHIAVDASGNVYVSGDSRGDSSQDVATVKYDSNGNQLWASRFTEPGTEESVDLALDGEGNVIVALDVSYLGRDFVLVKYAADGAEQWVSRHNSGGYQQDTLVAIDVDSSGNAYATGHSEFTSFYEDGEYHYDYDILTLRVNSAGETEWISRYAGPEGLTDSPLDIALDGLGGLYVTGFSASEFNGTDLLVLRYDTNGVRYWHDIYNSGLGSTDRGIVVRPGPSNCVYAAGVAIGPDNFEDVLVIKYSHQDAPGVPAIITSPHDQTVIAGNPATFTVAATGTTPLTYQWRFERMPIPGATGSTLQLPNVQPTNAGNYSVDISNEAGLIASPEARLTVRIPATIVAGPEDQCIVAGSEAVFRIVVVGDGEIGTEWRRDALSVSNYSPTLRIQNAQSADAGPYSVTVSNQWGAMTASARLIITPRTTLAWANSITFSNTHEQPYAATTDPAGNIYIAGSGPGGFLTAKIDSTGAVAWARAWDGTNGGSSVAQAIAVDAAGNVYVSGSARGPETYDIVTIKYSPSGDELWRTPFDSEGADEPSAIKLDALGNVYVAGAASYLDYYGDFVTIK
ncbi:MAG: immunoglobulin domain-containing protein, partial [Verrucomicrobia subdivision 3 bacterium]|nr:immunoglobulin domain-containing protein [Limisphaerales bacterium]